MTRIGWFLLFASSAALAQSGDSQTLQSLLQEVRQLRQDMHGLTVVAQRVHILLYRVQLQDDATKKAAQRYDQASARLRDADRAYSDAANGLKSVEERLPSLQNQKERDEAEAFVRDVKRRLEVLSQDRSLAQAAESSAASDFKVEQEKLAELQQRLDQLERQLETLSSPSTVK